MSDALAPSELAGLDIVAELGRGASTVVYRARRDGTEYALKVVNAGSHDEDGDLTAFRREAAIMASIDHPGLPHIYDVGQTAGRPYLIMDLIEGRQLSDLLIQGPLPAAQAISVALDVAGALTAAHRRGLVHRDIKPPNIIVVDTGEARLIDFGFAVRESGDLGDAAVGTFAYAPPEQSGILKRPVDNRSDLYSLGVVLFECLAGRRPFDSADAGALLRMHAVSSPPDLRSIVPGVPDTLCAMVAKLLAKDPDDRYRTGVHLIADLKRLAADPDAVFAAGQLDTTPESMRAYPLCGRAAELAQLTARWAEARAGRGGVCLLRGPSGIGKSRLAAELVTMASADRAVVLSGTCAGDDLVPLSPLHEAVEGYLGGVSQLPADERETLHDRVRGAAGAAAGLLAPLAPELRRVLGVGRLGEGERQEQVAVAIVDFLCELARVSGGLLLYLDDIQWLDVGTRRVLSRLSTELVDAPLLVIATARDDGAGAAGDDLVASLGGMVDINLSLGPLAEPAVADLVAAQLPGMAVGPELVHLLAVRGAGSPFAVMECLRAVIDAGLVRPCWGAWLVDLDAANALDLPQDILGLVLARMTALGSDTRLILRTAAAIGPRFRPEVVATVCGVDVNVAISAAVEGAGHLLVEAHSGGDYAFLHGRIREALLDGLDEHSLQTLHLRIAETLDRAASTDPEQIYAVAHHYMLSPAGVATDRVFAACCAAGRLALQSYAASAATAFLMHAEGVGTTLDSDFLYLLGTALQQDGRYTEARERLQLALTRERSRLERGRILMRLVEIGRATWNTEDARVTIQQGFAELGVAKPKSRLGRALSASALCIAGVFVALTGIRFGAPRGEKRERYKLLVLLSQQAFYIEMVRLRPDLMFLNMLRPQFWTRRLRHGSEYVRGMGMLGTVLTLLGLQAIARGLWARVRAAAEATGDPQLVALVAWYHGCAIYMSGWDDGTQWKDATRDLGRWLDRGEYSDAIASFSWEAAVLGRTREAVTWFERGRRRFETCDDGAMTSMVTIDAVVKTATGRHTEAAAELRRISAAVDQNSGKGLKANLVLAEMYCVVEQGEFGAVLDETAQRFFALGLKPALAIRQHRLFFVPYAFGRLAQCRSARDEATRAGRLAAATKAVRQLHTVANTPVLKAFYQVARADLDLLGGRPQRAFDRVARIQPARPDSPMLAFEAARARARALRALGHVDAERQATYTRSIALDEGWSRRARWVQAEFGLAESKLDGTTGPAGSSTTMRSTVDRDRLHALQTVSKAAARVLDPEALARIALDETIRILGAERAFLFLTVTGDDGVERLVPHIGRDTAGNELPELTGYSASLVDRVYATSEPLVVTGTEEGAVLGAQSVVAHGLRSVMVAPLQLDGRLMGVVYLDSRIATGVFTSEEAGILTALTNHIATAMETARAARLELSVQVARQQRDLAEQLRQALAAMSSTLDPDDVLTHLVEQCSRLVPCTDAWLIVGTDKNLVERYFQRGDHPPVQRALPADPAIVALLACTGPMAGPGAPIPAGLADRLESAASWIIVPLKTRSAASGVLVVASDRPDAYRTGQLEVAAALVAQGVVAYEHASLFTQVRERAVIDELTGIANRRHFFEVGEPEVDSASRSGRPLVALMADIDHFKAVNDTYGHPTGDDVIQAVADRLSSHIRATDVLARYGGEEFVLLLPDTNTLSGTALAERLREAVGGPPVPTRSGPLPVTVSIGVALSLPDETIGGLLARADQALYRAKRNGRNRVLSV